MHIIMKFFGFIMILLAFVSIHLKNLIAAVFTVGFVSLGSAVIFLYLQAPDVAMTEAVIGAGLSTVIFILAVRKTKNEDTANEK